MNLVTVELLLFGMAIAAGMLGSVLGLGGGVVVIPALTIFFGVPIRLAIGASIVSVIATSSGAAASFVKLGYANLNIAMFLEMGTAIGAVGGASLGGALNPKVLYWIFSAVLIYSASQMFRRPKSHDQTNDPPAYLTKRLNLAGSFFDVARTQTITYQAKKPKIGLFLMTVAGLVSGLLGVGSGVIKVPALDVAMGLPIKVSTATSNFMIGVTAAASAGVYFLRGDISPLIAGPVALGVFCGAFFGARLLPKVNNTILRAIFVVVLIVVSVQMVIQGIHS